MRHAFLLGALVLALVAPPTLGQGSGTQLHAGDADFTPVAKSDSIALSVNENDFGTPGEVGDNCLLADTGKPSAGAQAKDIRLTPCQGFPGGSLVVNTDAAAVPELAAPYPNVPGVTVQYADVNNNGKYDKGDGVYVTTSAAAGLVASRATGAWTVRVTQAGDQAPFTWVLAGDRDLVAYGGSAKLLAGNVVERSDGTWFLVLGAAGTAPPLVAKGGLVPENSIRLTKPGAADVRVAALRVAPAAAVVGRPLQLGVDVENKGKSAGSGVLATAVDGTVVDTRPTPWLDAGGKATVTVSLPPPAAPGTLNVSVGPVSLLVPVAPASGALPAPAAAPAELVPPDLGPRVTVLEQRADALERDLAAAKVQLSEARAELAKLRGADGAAVHASSAGSEPARAVPAPLAPAMLLVVLGAALLAARRRA